MSHVQNQHHILCINNSEDVLALFRELLGDEGYRVTTQSYVDKNLDAISELNPDLIILDYMWDHEDSGWALLQMAKMSPKTRGIPIVLCTGAVKQVSEMEAHLLDMKIRVVLKPFDIDLLLEVVAAELAITSDSPVSD